MIITNKITMDLQRSKPTPTIDAVQTDTYSRNLEIELLENGEPFLYDGNLAVVIRYRKLDGTGGEYDTLPDGSSAWTLWKNYLTIALAPQVLTFPGNVLLSVSLAAEGKQLSTFPVELNVRHLSRAINATSENYLYLTGLLPAPSTAEPGQYLQVAAVDSGGKVTGVQAVPAPENGSAVADPVQIRQIVRDYLNSSPVIREESDPTVPDWAKQPEKPGYTADEVGAEPLGNADSKILLHDQAAYSHSDIRTQVKKLTVEAASRAYVDQIISATLTGLTNVKPLFANSVADCVDTNVVYVLPDGYIYAYLEGKNTQEVVSGNLLSSGIDTTGAVMADGTNVGWKADFRLNSSGVESEYSGMDVTGYIPIEPGDKITIAGAAAGSNTAYFHYYDSTFNWLSKADGDKTGGESPNNTYTVTNERAAYFRMTAVLDDAVITITRTVVTEGYAWASTGHAFVPADYEDRIITVEETAADHEARIADLETSDVPDYVVTEAESVIDRVIAAQGERTFTFAAITDLHYGNGGYTEGVDHACQAMKYIDSRIKLDAVAVLGDYTDGLAASAYDGAIADFKAVNHILDGLRFAPNLRLHGNHDFYKAHSTALYRYIPAYSDGVVWGSKLGGYFYRDFEDFNLRVICLNTTEENSNGLSCATEQYNWFAGALDLSGKSDAASWQTLILSHHPLDWFYGNGSGYVFWQILNAYITGTSWSNSAGTISCDFAGKNSAKLVGNIHGHIHNLLTRNIAAGQPNTTADTIALKRIATPEACCGRENSYNGTWDYDPFGEETSYPKTQGTAQDTAFCVYCIDLDTCSIKAVCYGAGYDREITY